MKLTKMVKFVFVILLLIPSVLLATGIIQTFVIKSKQNELKSATANLEQSQKDLDEAQDKYDYASSDEYNSDYNKYVGKDGQKYGDENDVDVTVVIKE